MDEFSQRNTGIEYVLFKTRINKNNYSIMTVKVNLIRTVSTPARNNLNEQNN